MKYPGEDAGYQRGLAEWSLTQLVVSLSPSFHTLRMSVSV